MSMNKHRQRGFTLIEVIIFIVVVGAGMAGILSVSTTVVKSSADPMVRKQALAIAESVLEEVLQKEYCDPDTVDSSTNPPTCPVRIAADQEGSRNLYDDVDDYNAATQALFNSGSGAGAWPVALDGYALAIAVTVDTTVVGNAALPAKRVQVTVSRGNESVALVGYRGNY